MKARVLHTAGAIASICLIEVSQRTICGLHYAMAMGVWGWSGAANQTGEPKGLQMGRQNEYFKSQNLFSALNIF